MRSLLVVLSAAVTAGLAVSFAFNAGSAFADLSGKILVPVDVFVAFVAVLAIVASGLALAFRALLLRGDRRQLQDLRDRVASLEAARGAGASLAGSGSSAAPPPAAS